MSVGSFDGILKLATQCSQTMQATVEALAFEVGLAFISFVYWSVMTTAKCLRCSALYRGLSTSVLTGSRGSSGKMVSATFVPFLARNFGTATAIAYRAVVAGHMRPVLLPSHVVVRRMLARVCG